MAMAVMEVFTNRGFNEAELFSCGASGSGTMVSVISEAAAHGSCPALVGVAGDFVLPGVAGSVVGISDATSLAGWLPRQMEHTCRRWLGHGPSTQM